MSSYVSPTPTLILVTMKVNTPGMGVVLTINDISNSEICMRARQKFGTRK